MGALTLLTAAMWFVHTLGPAGIAASAAPMAAGAVASMLIAARPSGKSTATVEEIVEGDDQDKATEQGEEAEQSAAAPSSQ